MFLIRSMEHTKVKMRTHAANSLTLLNISFGIIAIILVVRGYTHTSQLFIFLAAFSDRFDGMLARKLNTESDFGKQLDSLCDLVSFGIAPAILIYQTAFHNIPDIGLVFITVYILCGAIRLARFNVKEFDGAFYGIPITAAGIILTFFSFFVPILSVLFFGMITAILSILMVSNIRIPKM
ncbi:CDP-diacylglycerol--serine O-phosphatidyltransferase [Ornithinibacillus sp. L9]|uniref:CDP-diacylglycerol--serine O-phosphatidyltransferase n=1 Tax=Ornithinibacillus caprae TaxID=2678566 RepID=A0A6N8FDK0_9BACI|nr:CDP-diacylglycerol--serine O-phosphatidyltransferase [Ornithinibacillus caprae]MUK87475.1 CDP-diacylglycerol--serine O-phosphatidyltransferase [Ornithinibacillus caprae]